MRIVLVGRRQWRARMRAELDRSMEVVGEFATRAAADGADLEADALLVSTDGSSESGSAATDESDADPDPLTPREIQVLELLAEGLSNKGIAGRLGISDQTVKFHVASLCGKLGARNRTDAVRLAIRRGVVAI
jgi:DNA-binding NarL/FixJ family response regulator